jgi:hypothetical protein
MRTLAIVVLLIFCSGLTTLASGEIMGYVTHRDGTQMEIAGDCLGIFAPALARVCNANARIFCLETGLPCHDEIPIGTAVRAIFDEYGSTIILWKHWDSHDAAAFSVVAGQMLTASTFLCEDGKYMIFLPDNTHAAAGDEYFIWVEHVTASRPAMVHPRKAVRIQ